MKNPQVPIRNIVISFIIHALTVAIFYCLFIAGWEFLDHFTNHSIHGKLSEGLGSYHSFILFAIVELILTFIPALKWKIPFIALYAVLMFLQWFGLPPYYTPYRFLYHAVLGTALMIFTEVIIKHAVKVRKI